MATSLAPSDKRNVRGERLAQRHEFRLAFVALACHYFRIAMRLSLWDRIMEDIARSAERFRERAAHYRVLAVRESSPNKAAEYRQVAKLLEQEATAIARQKPEEGR